MTSTPNSAPNLNIYQIFYDDESQLRLDSGFIALDNRENLRPDWAELWPIRQFLHEHTLEQNDFYGFLSSKFQLKTGLDASNLKSFINQHNTNDIDAFVVSPYWDLMSMFRNVFEQGDHGHSGLLKLSEIFLHKMGHDVNLSRMISHSQNTAFCNYVIAKPAFWMQWLKLADGLFAIGEGGDELAKALSEGTNYNFQHQHPIKIFIQERLSSFLLSNGPWRVVTYDSFSLPMAIPALNEFRDELIACDALKQAYTKTEQPIFEKTYDALFSKTKHMVNQKQLRANDGTTLKF